MRGRLALLVKERIELSPLLLFGAEQRRHPHYNLSVELGELALRGDCQHGRGRPPLQVGSTIVAGGGTEG